MSNVMTRLHPIWFNGCGMSKAEGNGVVKEKGKESVGKVKLDIGVAWGLNLSYISDCCDVLSRLSLDRFRIDQGIFSMKHCTFSAALILILNTPNLEILS